ncbi:transaldolase [Enterococcus sp. 665A]|uniref:Transaldolase n=2 Tax=Candidatus Enterococcus ferrettii TaxID=2815324 RepID=A0ABV0EP31_9ENTE|nr:transaldolase family protein [Enterococcus sp. 665A]
MKFFLDIFSIEEVKRINELGFIDGMTTNPTIIAEEGSGFQEAIKEIYSIVGGTVSAEATEA